MRFGSRIVRRFRSSAGRRVRPPSVDD